jgi:tricarballylate dehydrogenase
MSNAEHRIHELEGPWDVVVVGHGAAGLTAALAYLESLPGGATPRVAVLDRNPVEQRGGSTAWTTAMLRLTQDTILDPEWGTLVRAATGTDVNDAYIDAFYEHSTDTLNWLSRRGIKIGHFPAPLPVSFGKSVWFIEGGGRSVVDTLPPLIEAAGGQIFYGTVASRLITSADGAVTGVVVTDADGIERAMDASAVVLACGGFEGNPELLAEYLPDGDQLVTVSPGTDANRGDGLRMAVAVGADTAGQFSGAHMEPVDPRSSNREGLVTSWMYGILVDRNGRRFVDETPTTFDVAFDRVANAIFRTAGGEAHAVWDAGIRDSVPGFGVLDCHENAPLKADTLAELAELMGVPAEGLEATVAEFNAAAISTAEFIPTAMDGRSTTALDPPKSNWAQPIAIPPFEAVPVKANICFTYGGLRVDGDTRVLATTGEPIPGLYAAGEITGIFCDVYPSGTSVLRSLTFGRRAGQVCAASLTAPPGDHLVGSA